MTDLITIRMAAQGGVLTTRDAAECGVSRAGMTRLVTSGRLLRIRTGAYVDRPRFEAASPEGRRVLAALAVCRQVGDGVAASHASALALHGLPVLAPRSRSLQVHVSRTRPSKHRPIAGVVSHSAVGTDLLVRRSGVLCVRPAAAVLQWASSAGLEAGVVAADAALHQGLSSRQELRQVLGVLPLGRGRGTAGRVPELADGRSESVGESRTRVILHALGLPEPEPQAELWTRTGALIGRVDFLYRRQRTVVEFDGLAKYGGDKGHEALVREKAREDQLRALGLEVVRLVWRDLDDPALVLDLVRAAFARGRRSA